MARSVFVGDTNYSAQPFSELINDLKNWLSELDETFSIVDAILLEIPKEGRTKEPLEQDFQLLMGQSYDFWNTCKLEIAGILADFSTREVQEHHVRRLRALGKRAYEFNSDYRKVWSLCSYKLGKYDPVFYRAYGEGRTTMGSLIDLQNLANRVSDFVGMKATITNEEDQSVERTNISPRVFERVTDLLLETAKHPSRGKILSGQTLDSDPDEAALDEEAAEYCYSKGWAKQGSEKGIFNLTASGYDYAQNIKRDERENALEKAIFKILEEAESNNGKIIWFPDRKIVQAATRLGETVDEIDLFNDAAWTLTEERKWLLKGHDATHRVTEAGRKALRDRSTLIIREQKESVATMETSSSPSNRNIFIVHGHDTNSLHELQAFLLKLEFKPIVLFEETNKGRTIIEKFENEAANAAFAIVLLTPDDVGGARPLADQEPVLSNRARQNVIFELGFFFAKLQRHRVVALMKGELEHPSDIHGIVYQKMDDGGVWKISLAKEMRDAGLKVDMNAL